MTSTFKDINTMPEKQSQIIMIYEVNSQAQERIEEILKSPITDTETQIRHSWNGEDSSPNIVVKNDCKLTLYRQALSNSTDCIRGKVGYTTGVHVWEVLWQTQQRGSDALIGVATINAPLQCAGYKRLVGSCSESWGWDIQKFKLYHNGKNAIQENYPKVFNFEKGFVVPDRFFMILDMECGTLSFMANGLNLGIAFGDLKGRKLYPIVNTVWGHCEVTLKYIGGRNPEPPTLQDVCKHVITKHIGRERNEVGSLHLPKVLQSFLLQS